MTDYSHLVTDDMRVLDANQNGSTPYDVLFLSIDEDDVTLYTSTMYGGDGVPMDVWHGTRRRYQLLKGLCVVDLNHLRKLLGEGGRLSLLIDRVKAGLSTEWDGSNWKGGLDEDAQQAENEIEREIDRGDCFNLGDDSWAIWDEGEWVYDEAKHKITAKTTDEEIAAWLEEVRKDATSDNVILVGDATEQLTEQRDRLREEAEEEQVD